MVMRVAKAERSPAMLGANGQAQQHMPSPHSPRRLSSVYTVAPEVGGCLEAERENQSAGPSLEEGVGRVQTGSWRSGAEFAMQTKDKYKFRGGNADPYQTVKGWLQRHLFLRHTGYEYIWRRLLDRLKHGVPVVMVLPGGLPHNARLLYAAREFILKLPITRWPYSKRIAQQKWMDVLRRPVQGKRPCEKGEIPPASRESLRQLLGEWGLPDAERDPCLELFEREFRQEVPYRTRLMRVLLQRLAARGKPVLLMAIAHSDHEPYVRLATPWGFYRDPQGQLRLLQGPSAEAKPVYPIEETAMAFSALYKT